LLIIRHPFAMPFGKAAPPLAPRDFFWLHAPKKPYYNPRTLEDDFGVVKRKLLMRAIRKSAAKHSHKSSHTHGFLRISDVARIVGVSPSILRSWENLGLISPTRTRSKYRLYTHADVRLLKRAQFLHRHRRMNIPAVVHMLKAQGLLKAATHAKGSPIGERLRKLRLSHGDSLARVAKAADVSVGFLSALERGHMSASVATLRRLARFYRINILSLFDPSESNPGRVRPAQRKVLEAGRGVRMELLSWGNTVMEPHLFRIAPSAGSGEFYSHEGEEFLFILQGCLEIELDGGEHHLLEEGDSFYFESSSQHRWSNPGDRETRVLWINTPPTF
jgi:DNA-binding transcriptional MerR regulator/quercetin dioxygenase-like cupin family protein